MSPQTTASYDPGTPGSLAGLSELLTGVWEEEEVEGIQSWKRICLIQWLWKLALKGRGRSFGQLEPGRGLNRLPFLPLASIPSRNGSMGVPGQAGKPLKDEAEGAWPIRGTTILFRRGAGGRGRLS